MVPRLDYNRHPHCVLRHQEDLASAAAMKHGADYHLTPRVDFWSGLETQRGPPDPKNERLRCQKSSICRSRDLGTMLYS